MKIHYIKNDLTPELMMHTKPHDLPVRIDDDELREISQTIASGASYLLEFKFHGDDRPRHFLIEA